MPTTNRQLPPRPMGMIERAFARNLVAFVAGYRELGFAGDVDMLEVAGGVAAFVGVGSPLTTVKGLPGDVTAEAIDGIEAFFRTHHVPSITIELAPWGNAATSELLTARGYVITAKEDVVARTVDDGAVDLAPAPLEVISIAPDELVKISRGGFEHAIEPLVDELLGVAARLPGSICLGVRTHGRVIACGQAVPDGDAVVFGNDTTLPDDRRLGAQTALIRARLAVVKEQALAIAEVAPASGSERNYLRCGFEVAYSRSLFRRALD